MTALDGVTNTETLVSYLRRRDQNAEAELTALYLIRAQNSNCLPGFKPQLAGQVSNSNERCSAQPVETNMSRHKLRLVEAKRHVPECMGMAAARWAAHSHRFSHRSGERRRVMWRIVRKAPWDGDERKHLYREAVEFLRLRAERWKYARSRVSP